MQLSKRERRKLKLEKLRKGSHEAQDEYENRIQSQFHHQEKPGKSKFYIIATLIGIFVLIIAYSVYSFARPGPYDGFAKCLSEKGVVMYGAMDWCEYTQGQKAMFGRSFRHLNYYEHTELPGIKKTPTWVINGEWHENVQSFDKLAALTGCKL